MHTIIDACHQFFENTSGISLITLNVQSLKAHFEDIITDTIIPTAEFLIFTESWLKNDEYIDVPGYKCLTQFKREELRVGGTIIYQKNSSELMTISVINPISVNQNSNFCGDICGVKLSSNKISFWLIGVHISPGNSLKNTYSKLSFSRIIFF